ncbi:MAG: isoprenyl transferase [Bdellovibrionales bacterium]|nr:isoprenyl transferase [Bdellovibrionales bacterium]
MSLPNHLAIIMDGNGRWAQSLGKRRLFGHIKGVGRVREVVKTAAKLNISFLTLYAFSMENWMRPKEEVKLLMNLLIKFLKKETRELNRQNIRLQSIGDTSYLPEEAQTALALAIDSTKGNSGMVLTLALSYGSRQEITQAIRQIIIDHKNGGNSIEEIDEAFVNNYLQTAGMPDPDLIIRTSGEYRLSNFLLWQAAYAEIVIIEKAWPDFVAEDLVRALEEYSSRERRFGKTSAQVCEQSGQGDIRELN